MQKQNSIFLLKGVQALFLFLTFFFFCISANAQQRVQGFVEVGGFQYSASSTAKLQRSFPSATVTVYDAGTTTLASIFSNNLLSVPKSNPFLADSTGYWYFYATNGRYDVKFSGTELTTYTYGDIVIVNSTTTPATTTTLGTVILDTAPTDAANPIVVGINSAKLNYLGSFAKASLPNPCVQEKTASVTDNIRGLWICGSNNNWSSITGGANIKDFGAKGDGTTNDSAAIQSAASASVGNGYLLIPEGKFRIATAITTNLTSAGSTFEVRGMGNASQIYITTGLGTIGWSISNSAEAIHLKDFVFVGNPAVADDALVTLNISNDELAVLDNVNFYGLGSFQVNGAILNVVDSSIELNHCMFSGSSASSGTNSTTFKVSGNWKLVKVDGCKFKDFGVLNSQLHSKTGIGAPISWIYILNPTGAKGNITGQNSVVVEHSVFDEGGLRSLSATSDLSSGQQAINSVTFRNNTVNLGNIGNIGVLCQGVDNCVMEDSVFGYTTAGANLAYFSDTPNMVIRRVYATTAGGYITFAGDVVRGSYLSLENSQFTQVNGAVTTGGIFNYINNASLLTGYGIAAGGVISKASLDALVANGGLNVGSLGIRTVYIDPAISVFNTTFASLGTPANGRILWCSDCNEVDPCAGSGNGAWAKRQNGRWKCN